MSIQHLEVLVEEPSMERVVRILLPKIVGPVSFEVRTFDGKSDLLKNLRSRLLGYRHWSDGGGLGIVVVVDRDDDDCVELLERLRSDVGASGLGVASAANGLSGSVLLRLAIEELEAWFFGDVNALSSAYPGVPSSLAAREPYRDPDAIKGGTWEALQRVLQTAGHHRGGLRKIAAADEIARHMQIDSNTSVSFQKFRDGLRVLVGQSEGSA